MALAIRKISYALGAEVTGIDLSKPLDDEIFDQVRRAFLEHQVLLFRGQRLTREQHIAFSRRFGELVKNQGGAVDNQEFNAQEFPEIYVVLSKPKPNGEIPLGRYQGENWHTDRSHLPAAAHASLLRSIQIPDVGGDTMFCNMYTAYETLSDGMKKLLEGLTAVYVGGGRVNPVAAAHPAVRVHPDTGRKSLYVDTEVKLFVGMTAEESQPLIEFLCSHATRPQFVYRHIWQKHDLVIWDDRCLLHHALGDYDRSKVRHMERTIVRGTPSGYVYEGPVQ